MERIACFCATRGVSDLTRRKDFSGWERIIFLAITHETHRYTHKSRCRSAVARNAVSLSIIWSEEIPRESRRQNDNTHNNGVPRKYSLRVVGAHLSYCCAIVRICSTGPRGGFLRFV